MARNSVQFQKGLSETEFEQRYGTEAACREALFHWRGPEGFECPICGERRHSAIKSRQLFQCSGCRRQTSLTAGTIFAATQVPLRAWFRAIYQVTQTKQGISSLELARRLGVTQTTAWSVMPSGCLRAASSSTTSTSAASTRAASVAVARPVKRPSWRRSRPRRRASRWG